MTKPKHFTLSSDFATTQNDARGTLSYAIPAGTVINNGATAVFQASAVVGKRNAYLRIQANTSDAASKWFSGSTMVTDANATLSGIGAVPWPVYHTMERTSPTSIRAYCEIFNNSGATMTIVKTQTISFEVNTFLSPFPN